MKSVQSEKSLRLRKFLLMLPVLALPFITVAFYAMGGGGGTSDLSESLDHGQGLNVKLPGVNQKEESLLNKMSFYEKAEKDSAKIHEAEKNDPYYRSPITAATGKSSDTTNEIKRVTSSLSLKYTSPAITRGGALNTSSDFGKSQEDQSEQKIMAKLAELNKAINQPAAYKNPDSESVDVNGSTNQEFGSDVTRLENMIQSMKKGEGEDPEMERLNGTLDKILEIQHPERTNEKIKAASVAHKTQVFPVNVQVEDDDISLISSSNEGSNRDTNRNTRIAHSGFYSLEEKKTEDVPVENGIEAVIHETRNVISGATVKLRLTSDIYINGMLIPRGTFVYGTASLNDERLKIRIGTIRYLRSIYPVSLAVYDMDGIEGIFIPGAISRDVSKESAGQALQGIGLTTLDPSISAQAASAGIQAAKSLLTKKAKLVRVTVKSGYQVLLKDESQKN